MYGWNWSALVLSWFTTVGALHVVPPLVDFVNTTSACTSSPSSVAGLGAARISDHVAYRSPFGAATPIGMDRLRNSWPGNCDGSASNGGPVGIAGCHVCPASVDFV
jgi:hypothetical protein